MNSGNKNHSAVASSSGVPTGVRGRTAVDSGLLATIDNALRDQFGPWDVPFAWLEHRTGLGRMKLFFVLASVAFAYLLSSGPGANLLGHAIGLTYPAYACVSIVLDGRAAMMAIGDGSAAGPAERWLVYWMMYSMAIVVEQSLGGRLILGMIPQWCLLRTLFFVWCQLPGAANGTALVYIGLHRYFSKYFSADPNANEL